MSQVVLQLELALEQQESRNLAASSNHIDEVAPDVSPPNEDNVLSDIAEISNESFKDVQTVTFHPTKHTNSSYVSGKKDGRKQKRSSPPRFLAWGWGTFWNRINPINKSIISETHAGGIKLPSDLSRRFSLDDIKTATHKFSELHVIGRGGHSIVYKGLIDGVTTVAIKRLKVSLYQGDVYGTNEFLSEIEVMSKLRHFHLVSLIGYCYEKGEIILVYDYVDGSSLYSHLHNSAFILLTWKERLQICLGAAKGLHYLHTGIEQTIIHRDVKSANILVNEKLEAKICGFGKLKVFERDDEYDLTLVQGTVGYLDPEYFNTCVSTEKSDVYSFGVTLFEVLCGKRAVVFGAPDEEKCLAAWVMSCYREGTLENIIDSNVKSQITPECLAEFADTAVACLSLEGDERPSMRDIVLSLESAIKFQESAEQA